MIQIYHFFFKKYYFSAIKSSSTKFFLHLSIPKRAKKRSCGRVSLLWKKVKKAALYNYVEATFFVSAN